MKTSRYHLHLERCDPARNMARFYALSLEPSLFGEIVLVRRWGRIGASGRSRLDVYADEATAIRAMLALLRQKRARGYAVGQWGRGTKGRRDSKALGHAPHLES